MNGPLNVLDLATLLDYGPEVLLANLERRIEWRRQRIDALILYGTRRERKRRVPQLEDDLLELEACAETIRMRLKQGATSRG